MINLLELVSDEAYRAFFVDLYVRCNNNVAIGMYEGLGYSVYRRVREYYGSIGPGGKDEEDAFGMSSLNMDTSIHSVTNHFHFQICVNPYPKIHNVVLSDRMEGTSWSALMMSHETN